MTNQEKSKKRRPGRPPTKKKEIDIPVNGIASKPKGENRIFEMAYCNPITFKNIYGLFKNYNASVIRLKIEKTKLTFISQSQSEITPIFITIDADRMNHYYCEYPLDIYLKLEQFYDAFNYLDKKGVYTSLFQIAKNNDETLYITVEDKGSSFRHNYSFELINNDEIIAGIDESKYNENEYPLIWTISTIMFKKLIHCASSADGIIHLEKDGGNENKVSLSYSKGKRTKYTGRFMNNKVIKLKDSIDKDKCLNIELIVKNITGFTKSSLGDDVQLAADFAKPFCMKTHIDYVAKKNEETKKPAFTIKVFVPND